MSLDASGQLTNLSLSRTRKPAEIYKFYNDNNAYYLTDGDSPIIFGGQTYNPAYIKRGKQDKKVDLTVSHMTIQVDYLQSVVAEYLGAAPIELTYVEVRRVFRNQTPKESLVVFIGVIEGVDPKGMSVQLSCAGIERLLRVQVPGMRYQPGCQLTLYGTKCGVDKDSYSTSGEVLTVASDGLSFTISEASAQSDGYYNLGFIKKAGAPERKIANHVGTTIYLRNRLHGLIATDTVTLYAGCDKNMTTCASKFNNLGNTALDRFLGFPYIPLDNPVMWQG